MRGSDDNIHIKRVDPFKSQAVFWQEQLHQYVRPFTDEIVLRDRKRFPLPYDAIVLVAEDVSQPGPDGKAKEIGSVAIKKLLPGEEPAQGLPEDVKYGEIKRMVVLADYQRIGVASKLVERVEEAGKNELGLQCIVVETLHTLNPANKFCEKQGYKKRGVYGVYDARDSVLFEKWV